MGSADLAATAVLRWLWGDVQIASDSIALCYSETIVTTVYDGVLLCCEFIDVKMLVAVPM